MSMPSGKKSVVLVTLLYWSAVIVTTLLPFSLIVVATGTETRWKAPPEYWEISPVCTFRRNIPSGK